MKIGILSDTHNQLERTRNAIEQLKQLEADVLIHCGDITSPEIVEICSQLPTYYVFGNNDVDEMQLEKAITSSQGICCGRSGVITLADRQIAVTHGHKPIEIRQLMATNPHYLLTGHTHNPIDVLKGTTRHINPGALHRAATLTVALLDLKTDRLDFSSIPR